MAEEGDTLEVGEVIARIGEAEGASAGDRTPAVRTRSREPEEEPAPRAGARAERKRRASAESGNGGERVKASPVARRIADELGVELAQLEGSGPGGRIVKADVEAAAKNGAPSRDEPTGEDARRAPAPEPRDAGAKGEPEVIELSRLQQTVRAGWPSRRPPRPTSRSRSRST